MPSSKKQDFETFYVTTLEVACDGGGGALGHPRVYLHIDGANEQVVCPYCSRTYIHTGGTSHTH